MNQSSPFHDGELEVQRRAGVIQQARLNAAPISSRIPAGAMNFIDQQLLAVIGSLDQNGSVWASVVFGPPGFAHVNDDRHLHLRRADCYSTRDDPLWRNLEHDPRLGLLLIELSSRRRLRINGRTDIDNQGNLLVEVEQAYPNCPKYIQARRLQLLDEPNTRTEARLHGSKLNEGQQAWIRTADTFFVASAHPLRGIDASHRGGRPGFVQVLDNGRLRIPDYTGNSMFNTLGNFHVYPHAGLVFIDFERSRLLQLTGCPELLWDEADDTNETGGTRRYWEFEIRCWRESELPFRLDSTSPVYSPHIPVPRDDTTQGNGVSKLRIEHSWPETPRIRLFRLVAADRGPLPGFEAGAHLPVIIPDGSGRRMQRQYSLCSSSADTTQYLIGVQLEADGRGGSRYMHSLRVGDELEALLPRNDFPLYPDADHSLLIAGGVGITPLLSMMHTLHAGGRSFEVHYSARHSDDLAFINIINRLAGRSAHYYCSDGPDASKLQLRRLFDNADPNTHFYVCGPVRMIREVIELGTRFAWPRSQIHFESFGAEAQVDEKPLTVTLARSNRTIVVPTHLSILDSLLRAGIDVPHDCKRGECSLCRTRVLDGQPDHRDLCLNADERDESMCVCVSRAHNDHLTLVL